MLLFVLKFQEVLTKPWRQKAEPWSLGLGWLDQKEQPGERQAAYGPVSSRLSLSPHHTHTHTHTHRVTPHTVTAHTHTHTE